MNNTSKQRQMLRVTWLNLLVGFVLYRTRFNQVRLTQRVEALKETLDDER